MANPEYPPIGQVLSDLHASEINGCLSWFYDGEWRVGLGDPLNGWDAETRVSSIEDAVKWLVDCAISEYPNSEFATTYGKIADRTDKGFV